jgi:hypothetical protein
MRKNITKKIVKTCITFFKVNPTNCSYCMGNFSANRVNQARPFLFISKHRPRFLWSFYVKERKFRNQEKITLYTYIFICFTTKIMLTELFLDLMIKFLSLVSLKRDKKYRKIFYCPKHILSRQRNVFINKNIN